MGQIRSISLGIAVVSLCMAAKPVLAESASAGDCGPGTVKVCGTVTVKNTSGAAANDFHFYMYQNDRPNVQVMGATASSDACGSMGVALGTDDGTGSPPPGNHGASVDGSSCTPIPPGGTISVQICLCMNERNCIKFKDIYFTADGVAIPPGGGGGGGPPPRGGWRILRPYRGGRGGSGSPWGGGGKGAQEGNGGSGKWIHIVCIENDDTRWVVLEELKLLASMTTYANPQTDIPWAGIEPVKDAAGRPPVCIPPGGRWCFRFETTGAYLGGHVYQQYKIRPEFPGECSGLSGPPHQLMEEGEGDNSMIVVGDHPPETPLTEVLDIAAYVDDQVSDDSYRTNVATVLFGGGLIPSIPADFFGPGSEPFFGTVQLRGAPVDPERSDADTIVRRHGEAYLPIEGSVDTIPIELAGMALVSVAPITVTFEQPQLVEFDVVVPSSQTNGTQAIRAMLSADGGASIRAVRETAPANPLPPGMLLTMLASDVGGGIGMYGPQTAYDLFFQSTDEVPTLPPFSTASARFRVAPPDGAGLLPMEPPILQFTPSSFDLLFTVAPDGITAQTHHVQGSIPPGQPLQFQSVQIVSFSGTSLFEVSFSLQATGGTAPLLPLLQMIEAANGDSTTSLLYDVSMTLDPNFPAWGLMAIQRDSSAGGAFSGTLQVQPVITFSLAEGGPSTPPLPEVPAYTLQQLLPHGWQYSPPAFPLDNSGPNFFPLAYGPVEWVAPDGSLYSAVPALPPQPFGRSVHFSCSAAFPGAARIELSPGSEVFELPIPAEMSPEQTRDQMVAALTQQAPQYYPAIAGPDAFSMNGFPPGTSVRFATGSTAAVQDQVFAAGVCRGGISFMGTYGPIDAHGQPAVFTAGIVTDVGELTEHVAAQELNFQTDGPIICQALFQRLAPRAPQYGAEINFAGDRLEVYFDPAYTVTQGGVTFGTTSLSEGCSGEVTTPANAADFDRDGDVDLIDFLLFDSCVSGPAVQVSPGCESQDFDGDHDVDQADFGVVQRYLSGSDQPASTSCGG